MDNLLAMLAWEAFSIAALVLAGIAAEHIRLRYWPDKPARNRLGTYPEKWHAFRDIRFK